MGDRVTVVAVDALTRPRIVQYAGASGDFNPLHVDHRHATEVAGLPDVFAHGMFTMGVTARVLDQFDDVEIAAFGGRFMARVWPGDTLVVEVVATAVTAESVEVDVVTTSSTSGPVFVGRARLARVALQLD